MDIIDMARREYQTHRVWTSGDSLFIRHPVFTARMASAVDDLSNGRLVWAWVQAGRSGNIPFWVRSLERKHASTVLRRNGSRDMPVAK